MDTEHPDAIALYEAAWRGDVEALRQLRRSMHLDAEHWMLARDVVLTCDNAEALPFLLWPDGARPPSDSLSLQGACPDHCV